MITILGIDPGTARIGWGVITENQTTLTARAYGCITTDKDTPLPTRLLEIHDALLKLIKKYAPDAVSVEELYFSSNAKTAIAVGQARGIILLGAAQKHIDVYSYNPMTVKKTICGSGAAEKSQVTRMVVQLLRLKTVPKPDDTADALAIAVTHAYSYRLKALHQGAILRER